MFLITEKNENIIIMIGEKLDYMENGYPRMVQENVAFPDDAVNVYEVMEVPVGVIAEKYCYTPLDGFFINSKWSEPNNTYGLPSELYDTIRDEAVAQIEREVAGNANTETA